MNPRLKYTKWLNVLGLVAAGLLVDGHLDGFFLGNTFVSQAEARIGRPRTPASVAGVARRTTRRVIRRSTIYVGALPAGCVRVSINGSAYWRCGGSYYQSTGGRYVVVYVH
jgi:hypothetical protein